MKKINNISIIYSGTRKTDKVLASVEKIIESIGSKIISSLNVNSLNEKNKKKISKSNLILVLGGDGTMIASIRSLHVFNIPFLGINLGTVGFLTDLSIGKMSKLGDILNGHYLQENRPVFETFLDKENKEIFLNEVVIHSGSVTKMLELELSIGNQVIYNLRADGLIISSSTGSTAYSYSGGGPIISPKLDALSLLPMFSHSSSSHSLLLSSKEEIKVKIKNKNFSGIQLFVDGKKNLKYKKDGLKVLSTKKTFKLYHPKDYNYFEACRTKLGWAVSIENLKQD
jgi:NAD+ kinase|tara:strand:- start:203 stop:1054 length:852 start_codon:yes stop_codon:yes gene_type:complete